MKKLLQFLFLMFVIAINAIAQDRAVTGTVTAREDGLPLPGVSIRATGSTAGTTTDANGRFSLLVPSGSTSLTFSYIGYVQQVASITSNSVNISLVADQTMLSEVVVTAGGIKRNKDDLGYSISTVSSEELVVGRASNPVNSLAGKVAGVRVSSANGQVGSSSGIFIRGFTTFTGSNQPLFVVDGVPIDNGGGFNALQNGGIKL